MASLSTVFDPNGNVGCCEVFINHRGPDVKKTFASYLYRRLLSHGLRVFLDQHELHRGHDLNSQIENAIITASVHVAIFSPRYAESNWCLNELLQMLESGSIIIPVFYHVRPCELRWTSCKDDGEYARALHKLENKRNYDAQTKEEKSRYDSTTLGKWRNALSSAADISGFDLDACNGDEGELLDKVVERVLKKVSKTRLNVAKYPTGLDERVKDFENEVLLQQMDSAKPHVIGIVGLGGVGKTTLVKELFNRKSSQYSRCCFLSDVRENASKGSLILSQIQLLKNLTGSEPFIHCIDEGTEALKKHLSSYPALVILDDVDDVNQLDALLPVKTLLCKESLILITSRDQDVVTSWGVETSSIYKVTGLNTQYSRELFCSHAYNQSFPVLGFEYLVDQFLEACDGLPLSLKVFGALLYGKNDMSYWEDQLDRLKHMLPSEIQGILKISYEALNREEKQIFLDIACFFIGQNRDTAIRIWDGSGWKGWMAFQNLHNKCLVELDSENEIYMHDHLRDLGREIAEDSLPRRLWRSTENIIDDMLQQSCVITVRGIRMSLSEYKDNDEDDVYGGIAMRRLQFVDTEDTLLERILARMQSPNLLGLRWNHCPYSCLPSWIPIKNLRVLQVSGSVLKTLWEGEGQSQAPLQLRELVISAPLSSIPKSIGLLKHLEQIVVTCPKEGKTNVEKLPEEFCNLKLLKTLVLRECSKMKSLPDSLDNLTNLQHIDLSGCDSLERLPNSFGNLIRLRYLNLKHCKNLTITKETFGNITELEYLGLSYCPKIEVLPDKVEHQRLLEKLYLNGTSIKELPSAIGNLTDLEVLELGSPFLNTLPSSLGDLRNLKKLKLYHCKDLKCLPDSVRLLSQLTMLIVSGCGLCELPFKMVKGERETLERWTDLDPSKFDKCMPLLQSLFIYKTEISELSFGQGGCPNLRHLVIVADKVLVEIGTLSNTLTKFTLRYCSNLRKIGLCGLDKLQMLEISRCKEMEELPGIETLLSLEWLCAEGCVKLKSIKGLAQLKKLRTLSVSKCSNLEQLEGVEHCASLDKLDASGCFKLQWSVGVLEHLRQELKEGLDM